MKIRRGDVVLARFPHASGGRGKKRPVAVVQADVYNHRLRHAVVAQITSKLSEQGDPACVFIDTTTPDGQATGLDQDGLVQCYMLNLMSEDRIKDTIGRLSPALLKQVDQSLKAAPGIA